MVHHPAWAAADHQLPELSELSQIRRECTQLSREWSPCNTEDFHELSNTMKTDVTMMWRMQVEKSLKGARFSSFFGHRKRSLLACCFGLWLWPSLSLSMGAFKTKRRVGYVPTLPLGSLNSRATKPVWSMTELTDLLRPLTPLRDWFTVALALMEFARDLTSLTSAQRSPTNKDLFVVELMIWEVISVQFCHHDQMTRHNITHHSCVLIGHVWLWSLWFQMLIIP